MITLIDSGFGNITSVERAFIRIGADVVRSSNPEDIPGAQGVVLPGVGAFRRVMESLEKKRLAEPLREYLSSGRPYLGICLGLQLLFDESREHGTTRGLGIFPGDVERLSEKMKIPHMGWNQVEPAGTSKEIFSGIPSGSFFYFDHSYFVKPADESVTAAYTEYGIRFTSAAAEGKVWGVQFHPEKSAGPGLRLLENFVRMALGKDVS